MTWLLETATGNTLLVLVLAFAVLLISRVWRRAALLHAVWVLVLIKLVTPGFVPVSVPSPWSGILARPTQIASAGGDQPVTDRTEPSEGSASEVNDQALDLREAYEQQRRREAETRAANTKPGNELIGIDEEGNQFIDPGISQQQSQEDDYQPSWLFFHAEGGNSSPQLAKRPTVDAPSTETAAPVRDARSEAVLALATWLVLIHELLTAWLPTMIAVSALGTVFCLLLAAYRIARFQAAIRDAHRAPRGLQRRVVELSERMGLSQAPTTLIVPGRVSPMVWFPIGAPKLLFPKELLERLEGDALDSLLLHELAHVRRRDHWVRWLELIVTALCWWNPVVWIARREIHECEEECCDALVVANLPGGGKTYAAAIIETLDFLAGQRRFSATPLSCGVGRMAALERRLTQIMRPSAATRLSATTRILLCAAGLALLPMLPTWAQEEAKPSPSAKPAAARAEDEAESETPAALGQRKKAEGTDDVVVRLLVDPTEFESQPRSLAAESQEIFMIDFSHDGSRFAVASGRWDTPGSVSLWDAATRRVLRTWQTMKGVSCVRFSPDGRSLAAAGWDEDVWVYDLEQQGEVLRFHVGETTARLAYSPDGKWIASATEGALRDGQRQGNEVKLWDAESGEEVASLSGDLVRFQDIDFSSDGKWLAACGGEMEQGAGQVNLWDVESRRQVRVLKGYDRSVLGISFSSDGAQLAGSSLDGTTKIWEVPSGRLMHDLVSPASGDYRPEFSPDGTSLAVAGVGGRIELWNVVTGRKMGVLSGHSGTVRAAVFSPDGKSIVSGGQDQSVRFWDAATLRSMDTANIGEEGMQQIVLAVAHSPDARLLAISGEDRTVRIVRADDGRLVHMLEGFDDVVAALAFSPDGEHLATGCFDNTVRLWNVSQGVEVRRFDGHTNWVYALAFSPDGELLASGGYDKRILLWNVADGKQQGELAGHSAAVRSLAFSPSGDVLASGSADRTIKVWDVEDRSLLHTLKGHEGAIRAVAISSRGNIVASAAEDQQVRTWDLAGGELLQKLEGHEQMVWSLAFSPGGSSLASGDFRGRIKIWNPENGAERAALNGHQDAVSALSFAPDGRALVSGSYDKTVRVWQAKSPPVAALVEFKTGANPLAVAFSPDGKWLAYAASVGERKQVVLRNLASGEETMLSGNLGGILSIEFSPDARRVAWGGYGRSVSIWNLDEGKLEASFGEPKHQIRSVAFSPDGRRVAAAVYDGNATIWDVDEGNVVLRLPRQSLSVTSIDYSRDGKLLLTSTGDWQNWQTPGDLILWDAETGEQIAKLDGHGTEIKCACFSPDGRRIASVGGGKVVIWDVEGRQSIAELKQDGGAMTATFLPQGDLLAIGLLTGETSLWDIPSGIKLARFASHNGFVFDMAVSPDGSLLATGGRDEMVKLFSLSPAAEDLKVKAGSYLFNVDVSADGARVAVAAAGGPVLLDGRNGRVLQRINPPERKHPALDLSADGTLMLSGAEDGTLRLYDASTGVERLAMRGHQEEIRAAALSPDGNFAASAGYDKDIVVWDLSTGKERLRLSGHRAAIWSLAFSPDGGRLASGSSDGSARVWNLENGEQICYCSAETAVQSLQFTPDGRQLVAGLSNSQQCLWDADSGELVRRYHGNVGLAVVAALAPDGRRIYSVSDDGAVLAWDIDKSLPIRKIGDHGSKVRAIAATNEHVITAGVDGYVRIWPATQRKRDSMARQVAKWSVRNRFVIPKTISPSQRLGEDAGRLWFVAVSPDGSTVAAGGDATDVKFWDLATGGPSKSFASIAGGAYCGAFSPDTRYFAIGKKSVQIWDLERGERVASFVEDSMIRSVDFSPDGKLLAVATEDGVAALWSTETWSEVRRVQAGEIPVFSTRFSPDGKTLVTSTARVTPRQLGEIQFWDVETGYPITRVAEGVMTAPVFSPDGSRIAYRDHSGDVVTWNTLTKRDSIQLQTTNGAGSIAFSPDGRLLATGFGDGKVRLSDAETGNLIAELSGHADRVRSLAFTPDGTMLASAAFDGEVLLWNVAPEGLAEADDVSDAGQPEPIAEP